MATTNSPQAFTPNLFFNVTLSLRNPMVSAGGTFTKVWAPSPPSPFAAEDPQSNYFQYWPGNSTIVKLGYYGLGYSIGGDTQLTATGNVSTPGLDGNSYWATLRSDPTNETYATNLPNWGYHEAITTYATQPGLGAQFWNVTFTTGMKTQAPTLDQVTTEVVPFVQNGKPNRNSSYFRKTNWDDFPDISVVETTPVTGRMVAQPYEYASFNSWAKSSSIVITPPANTSYVIVNGTKSNETFAFKVQFEPNILGLSDDGLLLDTTADFPMSNVRLFMMPLNPESQYTIMLNALPGVFGDVGLKNNMGLSSMTFYSGLWNGTSDSTGTGAPQNETNNDSGLNGQAGKGTSVNVGAIAGGVAAGVACLALVIAAIWWFRRKKQHAKSQDKSPLIIDEDPLVDPYQDIQMSTMQYSSWNPSHPSQTWTAPPATSTAKTAPQPGFLATHGTQNDTSSEHSTKQSLQPSSNTVGSSAGGSSLPPIQVFTQEQDGGVQDIEEVFIPPSYNPEWELNRNA